MVTRSKRKATRKKAAPRRRKRSVRDKTIREVLGRVGNDINALTIPELQSAQRFKELQEQIKREIRGALGDKYTYGRRELAELFGINDRTVTRWAKQGKIPESRDKKWDIREVVRVLFLQAEGKDRIQSPEERLQAAKARREEIKLAHESGELVMRDFVKRMVGPALALIRAVLLGNTDRLLRYIPVAQRGDAREELEAIAQSSLKDLKEAFEHAATGG